MVVWELPTPHPHTSEEQIQAFTLHAVFAGEAVKCHHTVGRNQQFLRLGLNGKRV